ncbi:MAG: multi-sensor signal transduction histidine kinase [Polaromonas sp.]|nr:multi-sensor signal transduction histidine kinase [Polaromonas sp.]
MASMQDKSAEILSLIRTLHATDQRLDELLGGEVDSVMDEAGRSIVLRRAQGHLRQSEQTRQAAILTALPASIALLDARGVIVSVNAAWAQFGSANGLKQPGDAVAVNYLDVCARAKGRDSDEAKAAAAGIRSVLLGKINSFSLEYACHAPAQQRWFLMRVAPLSESVPSGAVVMHLDITERWRSQNMLRDLNADLEARVLARTRALTRQEALFHTLADQAPAIIWTLDASATRITYLNAEGARLLGGSAQDWLGKEILSIIHPDDLKATVGERMRALNACDTFESIRRLRSADASFRTMSCRASPVLDDQGAVDFWVGHELDITALKEIESALRSSNSELESFAYSIAHDLRSPLTIIDGFTRLLGRELGTAASERAVHLLTRMRASVKQMDEVSAGMLALAGISRTAMQVQTADLSQIAQEVAELLMERDPDRQVDLNIQNAMLAHCDIKMMRSLMSNLIGNAWKFTAKVECAQITFTSTSVPGSPESRAATVYCVRDNGAGFDMAYAEKLSLPFHRLHDAQEFEGTGLGLATVRKIVERHGGWLRLEGEVGKGACVWFTLAPSGAG